MPELIEQMYCAQQIVIPPKYPYILKRYCKATIKTQPYDLLRWSYEYFKALAENRPPPVKLRLEYPVYGTEGGLTKGCLKVLANQLVGMKEVPITIVKRAWQGFCLDPHELVRILCYCEVYTRADNVPFLHFIAVAAGLLTKCLTHTMILVCETLTHDPDGGAAAISVMDFLVMYRFLARMDCSKDCKYIQGYREGILPYYEEGEYLEEEEGEITSEEEDSTDSWEDSRDLMKINFIEAKIPVSNRLSIKMNNPVIGNIQRSPSVERAGMIDRENYMRERKEKPRASDEVDKMLKEMSFQKMGTETGSKTGVDSDDWDRSDEEEEDEEALTEVEPEITKQSFKIEEAKPEETKFEETKPEEAELEESKPEESKYEETKPEEARPEEARLEEAKLEEIKAVAKNTDESEMMGEGEEEFEEVLPVESVIDQVNQSRSNRIEFLTKTFEEIKEIVEKYKSTNYDLGMVAGRQMSTTSGEFVVQHIEKEIMDYIDDQIAVLPDPDLKRKKAKPEEVSMIKDILKAFLDENIDIICPEVEEVEEEELPIPDIVTVYAIPGIGPPVEVEITNTFEEYAHDVSKSQAEMIMPRNIRHFLCPPLEKFDDSKISGLEINKKTTLDLPVK